MTDSDDDIDKLLGSCNEELKVAAAKSAAALRKEVGKKKKADQKKSERVENPPTSLEELWETLCAAHGPSAYTLEVESFLDIFRQCQEIGLKERLIVALNPKETEIPPDLERNDVAHLCFLSFEEKDTTCWRSSLAARQADPGFKALAHGTVLQKHADDVLRLPQFKKLIPAIAEVMQIDMAFVLSAFVWVEVKRFEMPMPMYEKFFEKNSATQFIGREEAHERLFRNDNAELASQGKFGRNDFQRLCYSLDIVDRTGQSGKTWEGLSEFWLNLLKHIPEHLLSYADRRPGKRLCEKENKAPPVRDDKKGAKNLEGRTELVVFLENLFKQLPEDRFRSPLDLVTTYLCDNEIDPDDALAALRDACTIFTKDEDAAEGDAKIRKSISHAQGKHFFESNDEDGGGTLDEAEFAKVMRSTNPSMTDATIKSLFKLADKSGDGNVDVEEFLEMMETSQKTQAAKPPEPATASKVEEMKKRFNDLDRDGDGKLSLEELGALLRKGNPNMKDEDIHKLFTMADVNGDGTLDFDEFVNFLYGGGSKDKGSAGQPALKASSSAPSMAGECLGTKAMKKIFSEVAGKDKVIDNQEFCKLLQDSGLYSANFKRGDADIIFTKVLHKGERKLKFKEFQAGLQKVADRKDCDLSEVQAAISAAH